MKKLSKPLILIAAAIAGTLFYKVQHQLTAPGTSRAPGSTIFSSVTGPGSLMNTWKTSSADRDRATTSPTPPGSVTDDFPLLEAAANGDKKTVQSRLAAGAPADSRDNLRRTPLMYASWNGEEDIISRLIAAGANPETKDRDGNNAFDYAAGNGSGGNVEFLLKRTRTRDDRHYIDYAKLIDAAFAGDPAKLPDGKDKLAAINRINPEGVAPLYIAAGNGSVALMEAMIARGAQVNLANNLRQTALHWAAWNNQPKTLELLLAKGAPIEQSDLDGNTALMLAAKNNSRAAVELLLAKNADRYAANRQGKTASLIAEDEGHGALAELLK